MYNNRFRVAYNYEKKSYRQRQAAQNHQLIKFTDEALQLVKTGFAH